MNQNKYLTLVRREFWEHRGLWMWPTGVAVLLVLFSAGVGFFANGAMHVRGDWGAASVNLPTGTTPMDVGVFSLSMQILGVSGIVAILYLLDSLYAERKDRSILFWKSLPVSDAATVLAKLAAACLIAPLLAFLLAAAIYPLIYGIGVVGVSSFKTVAGAWSTMGWLRAEGALLLSLLVSLLWYAPLAAWMLLASVLATRAPISFAVLPIVVPGVLESLLLRTGYVWKFVGKRLVPIADPAEGILRLDLWLGLAVAAAAMYVVIRLRRYRDDT